MFLLLLAGCTHDLVLNWTFNRDGAEIEPTACNVWESFCTFGVGSETTESSCALGTTTLWGLEDGGEILTKLGLPGCEVLWGATENYVGVAAEDGPIVTRELVYVVPWESCCAGDADDDYDGLYGYDDPSCDPDPLCLSGGEDCTNGTDDDTDALIDCDDDDCAVEVACLPEAGFANVPAGTFLMGCTDGQPACSLDETEHSVTLTHDYVVGVTEVTQGEFEALMGYNPAEFSGCGASCPVESVSWHESAAYTNALSDAADLSQCYTCFGSGSQVECAVGVNPYDCDGYRLLTEAEWEGAARCGTDLQYAGSDDILDVGWVVDNSASTPHAVGGLAPNACGLYDMSGNVWEWTQDWYGDYGSDAATDPAGPESGASRVHRGGGWEGDAEGGARVSDRNDGTPEWYHRSLGFRVGRSIP